MKQGNELRQGIGNELWLDLPAHQRERKHPSPGDAVAPCGRVGFKTEIRTCKIELDKVMCSMCQGAA